MGGAMMPAPGGGGGRKRRRRGAASLRPMAEINVTPMVDVMLVLLIVFMVAAPLMTVGVPIQLPETQAEPLPTSEEEPLSITLTKDGQVSIQKTLIDRDELIPKLSAIMAQRSDKQIYLRADEGISYGDVMQVMGALNRAGFTKIGLVTDQGGPSFGGK